MGTSTWVSEKFMIDNEGMPTMEVFVNDNKEIFIGTADYDQPNFFYAISEDDWEGLKKFIDQQLGLK